MPDPSQLDPPHPPERPTLRDAWKQPPSPTGRADSSGSSSTREHLPTTNHVNWVLEWRRLEGDSQAQLRLIIRAVQQGFMHDLPLAAIELAHANGIPLNQSDLAARLARARRKPSKPAATKGAEDVDAREPDPGAR